MTEAAVTWAHESTFDDDVMLEQLRGSTFGSTVMLDQLKRR